MTRWQLETPAQFDKAARKLRLPGRRDEGQQDLVSAVNSKGTGPAVSTTFRVKK